MKQIVSAFLFLLVPLAVGQPLDGVENASDSGLTLSCTAYHQPGGPGTTPQSAVLALKEKTPDGMTQEIEYAGFRYQVYWHYKLTTLYMTILKDKRKILFTTSRVPSQDHNDSMADVTLPEHLRLYLTCDFVEYRPKS